MARTRQTRRKKKLGPNQGKYHRFSYETIVKENALLEQYYKAQNIIPEAEWPEFMEALKRDLPSTFRITGTRSHARILLQSLKKFFLGQLKDIQIEGEEVEPPKPLPWYPEELAWQINLSKKFIRKSESLKKFHLFLVHETENGNISRQEAVSMIPPLLMDVKPGQKILDACAAPGSKTAQIIELLHGEDSYGIPEGMVIANEIQNKRCYLLVHQSRRLRSPCFLITNNDAALYPTLYNKTENGEKSAISFDRILCDVPCSGDGTLRKNPTIWKKWNPHLGVGLHRLQMRILARAVEQLVVGGRIVYSTCTMNPIENEAIVATMLEKAEGGLELVDVSSELPMLKRCPGLLTWQLMLKDGTPFDSCEPSSEAFLQGYKTSMLPPAEHVAKALHLERCVRVYPHHQDTGGFFIAVLEKCHKAPWENENRYSANRRLLPWERFADSKKFRLKEEQEKDDGKEGCDEVMEEKEEADCGAEDVDNETVSRSPVHEEEDDETGEAVGGMEAVGREDLNEIDDEDNAGNGDACAAGPSASIVKNGGESSGSGEPPQKKAKVHIPLKEDPFVFLEEDDPHWPNIRKFYGIVETFPRDQLLVRSVGGKKRNIYLVSKAVKEIMESVEQDTKVINMGMKVIARANSEGVECDFRIMQEGIEAMAPFIQERKLEISERDVITLLTEDRPFFHMFGQAMRDQLHSIKGMGCVFFIYDPDGKMSNAAERFGCKMLFCGWKAKTSTRVLMSKFDRTHYLTMCGIAPGEEEDVAKKMKAQAEAEQADDPGKPGFIGDVLKTEPPEGAMDVGFI